MYDVFAMYDVFRSQHAESSKSSSSALIPFLQDKWLIVAHHVAIGVVFTPMIALKLDHDPGQLLVACALVMEGSTPFVSARAVLSQLGLKSSFVYLLNGVAMIIVFLSCRILVYPAFFWAYSQQRSISFLETFNRIPLWPCKSVLLLVLALQSYWFVIMIRGAARIVAGKQEASAAVNGNGVISSNGKKAQ